MRRPKTMGVKRTKIRNAIVGALQLGYKTHEIPAFVDRAMRVKISHRYVENEVYQMKKELDVSTMFEFGMKVGKKIPYSIPSKTFYQIFNKVRKDIRSKKRKGKYTTITDELTHLKRKHWISVKDAIACKMYVNESLGVEITKWPINKLGTAYRIEWLCNEIRALKSE